MNLFDETENKYYEFVSYLLAERDAISGDKLKEYYGKWIDGEIDFEVIEDLFSNKNLLSNINSSLLIFIEKLSIKFGDLFLSLLNQESFLFSEYNLLEHSPSKHSAKYR